MASDPHTHAAHGHDDHHDDGGMHGTLRDYVTGFLLAALLTAIPFWLVMGDVLGSKTATAGLVLAFAVVQIVVHMVYFLHMNSRAEGGWTILALIFTVIILVIVMAGSLWVMHNMNANMMPMPGNMTAP
ncbi:cytochrome o ubiquinol oxidase subunit IV [Pseudoroseomonas globiformis]|uniref:Cytochrome bo(3) ubiquinol oxidase subunit 4 n=1 Tax=Teichococcus globiformis TaxID=2307229 RepID=A0ABV7G0T3_9PROT